MQKNYEVKQFKINQEPIIKPNVIIIHATDNTHVKQKCIYFPGYRDAKVTEAIKALQHDKTVFFEGNYEPDRRTNQMQFVINKISNANKEQSVAESTVSIEEVLTVVDDNLKPLEERMLPERKYAYKDPKANQIIEFWSDGLYAWKQGHKDKKAKLNYEFLETYNTYCKAEDALLPDWYSVAQAEKLKNEQNLIDEFAPY